MKAKSKGFNISFHMLNLSNVEHRKTYKHSIKKKKRLKHVSDGKDLHNQMKGNEFSKSFIRIKVVIPQ